MKIFLLIITASAVLGLAIWTIMSPGIPGNPVLGLLVVFVFILPPLGSFWMLYVVLRYEEHPLALILLSFVPYAFIWYYTERVRGSR